MGLRVVDCVIVSYRQDPALLQIGTKLAPGIGLPAQVIANRFNAFQYNLIRLGLLDIPGKVFVDV